MFHVGFDLNLTVILYSVLMREREERESAMKGKEGIGRKSKAKAGRKELFKWKFFSS